MIGLRKRNIGIIAAVVVLGIIAVALIAATVWLGPNARFGFEHRGMMGSGYGFGYSPFRWFSSLLFWLVAFGAIAALWFTRPFRRGMPLRTSQGPAGESPIEILKQRYAKGEITREEYAQMRQDLEEQPKN